MNTELILALQKPFIGAEKPAVKVGNEVEVHQNIKDGEKERIQKFKGLVMNVSGKTPLEKTITVRKEIDGVAVEKIFAVYSPSIVKIDVIRSFRVRRANLGYIRRAKKSIRLKEIK